jgi:hypothetical protein
MHHGLLVIQLAVHHSRTPKLKVWPAAVFYEVLNSLFPYDKG